MARYVVLRASMADLLERIVNRALEAGATIQGSPVYDGEYWRQAVLMPDTSGDVKLKE